MFYSGGGRGSLPSILAARPISSAPRSNPNLKRVIVGTAQQAISWWMRADASDTRYGGDKPVFSWCSSFQELNTGGPQVLAIHTVKVQL